MRTTAKPNKANYRISNGDSFIRESKFRFYLFPSFTPWFVVSTKLLFGLKWIPQCTQEAAAWILFFPGEILPITLLFKQLCSTCLIQLEISFFQNSSEIRSANSVLIFVTNLVLKYLDTSSSHLTLQESMSYAAQILSLNLYCRWRNWTSVVCPHNLALMVKAERQSFLASN